MSFVLQLDSVGQPAATVVENVAKKGIGERQQPATPALLIACPLTTATGTITSANAAVTSSGSRSSSSDDIAVNDGGRSSQLLQKIETGNNQQEAVPTAGAASFPTQVKTVLTYPVAKGAREMQRTNTTQVLTTRVISQKLPSSTSSHQVQTVPVAADVTSQATTQTLSNSTSLPSPVVYPLQTTVCTQAAQPKSQTAVGELIHGKQQQQQQLTGTSNVQTTLHHKLHQVKTITTGTAPMSHIQRIHLKTNIIGQPSQTVNLHKVKTVVANQSTTVQRNSLSRIQGIQQKPQVLASQMVNQFSVNQTNANTQKIQQNPAAEGKSLRTSSNVQQQKAQTINAASAQKIVPSQSVCNNQKVTSQILSGVHHHPNHKIQQQQQQYPVNQQTTQQQGLQKLQTAQKTTVVARQQQQQSATPLNNISKSCGGTVVNIHKVQALGQTANLQQHVQQQQQTQTPHQKSQSAATLQKSQTMSTMTNAASRMQTCKSNSVPNISKIPQNSNVITVSKQQQQQIASHQQQQQPQVSVQLQQQLLQTAQQQQQQPMVVQKPQQQQSAVNANNLQTQKSHSITNMHQKVITTMPNNQRTQAVMSSKVQQQQQQQQSQQQQQTLMRIGISAKGQALQSSQSAGLKAVSQKVVNPMKAANSQNTVPQPVQKNSNAQPMKNIQQQQQNVISSQNAQKQPGCIKTIPPQKPVQRNHTQKVGSGGGIKTSLNTNVTALKSTATSTITQKASIKTLLPQQTVTSNIMAHKSSPIKIQQQVIQQKQLIMSPPYASSQQIRQQSGQLKTLLPVMATETRKDPEDMNNIEFRASKEEEQSAPKSPVRRMPLPYECLQFVLQDHNYGAPPPRTPPPPSPPPHPKQQPINGAGSSTATSQHPYIFCPVVSSANEDDAASVISSEAREAEPEGEETETAPEGEGDDEDSVTRCICDFEHDDGYMICCDRCLVWQHVDCMGIDRSNIPDEYLCERCRPRRVDRQRARALQMRKREELLNSDTSSDTSSTSSVDTDVGVNATQKKRTLPQQQSVPRRSKSDAPAQVRRLNNNNNNNNNNNVAKRQRRDSHPRQSSAVRKKEAAAKRGPGKRKAKRRMSVEDKEEDAQDGWGSSNMAPLRQWIERYEEAVTNHYSPELRARISSIKVNGTHSDLRQSNMNVIATGKCRLNVHSNNLRFLVATMYLPPNTPVVELRGKYMLSTQHRPQHPQGRQHAQRPGPFVFFYRLPRDGTEVCVDTRTYGNDARFVRRSCKPNAEVKHCIEKGTLHLYIVTTTAIEKNAEITIKHEQHDLLLSPNPNSSASPVVCACNNPRECQIATASQLNRRGSNGALVENADGRERRRRGRRNTVCEETESTPAAAPSTTAPQTTPTATTVSTVAVPPPRRTITTGVTTTTTTRQVSKEEPSTTVQQPQTSPSISQSTPPETKKDKKKMTREERKMEAIMKAFERLEKAEQRKQEVQARNAQRKESSGTHSDNEDNHSTTGQSKSKQTSSERPLRRKRRKGRARTTSTSQSQNNRRTRLNSAESDVSSGDESNSMQSPPLLGQTRPPSRDVPYPSQLHTPAKNTSEVGSTGPSGHHQGIPTAAGLLLALANSNAPPGPPSSPPLQQPTPVKSPTCDSGASSSSQSSTPSTPLSSACLLVAAAVGPLAPGLKFPKTKKALMNEWLKESPDLPPPQANIIPQVSPLSALPTASALPNSMNSALCIRQSDFPLPSTTADPSAEFLTQSYAAKSLATLVQAANSVSGICDSPPQQQRRQQQVISSFHNNNGGGGCPVSTGSAKKRWLRQAISEECDSPNSRPESPPALLETVAPPKKRRIARESLSSDNYTPPTTPTMLLPEAASNSRSLCPTEDEYTEHAQSPVVEQIDERHYEPISVKKETNMELDETIAREKLSIDIPQSNFYIKCEEKTEIPGIVKRDISPIIKTENAEMKEEISTKCEEDDVKPDYNLSAALHSDMKVLTKDELRVMKNEAVDLKGNNSHSKKISPFVKKEEETQAVVTGTVEIIDQNEPDTEMEDFSSPPWYRCTMEPDAILKQRVAEMQLEFGGGIAEIVNIASENEKPSEEEIGKCQEADKSDDNTSIDEFDVEAQMKKITGDDGNDYQEKIETSSERDKSMDGIEGLMESSKEDSDSEDKDMDDEKDCESAFKLFNISHENESPLKELGIKAEEQVTVADDDAKKANEDINPEPAKMEQPTTFAVSSEDSVFESTSSNIDTESVADPPKIFHSIPPLSERIRKKTTDPIAASKTPALDFEAAIIESSIDMNTTEESKNGEEKSMLSTALRELLEAKLDDRPAEVAKNDANNEATNASPPTAQTKKLNSPERVSTDTPDSTTPARPETRPEIRPEARPETRPEARPETRPEARPEEVLPKEEETKPKEIKRLKDPRTVVPNNMPAPSAFKPDALPPVKRKLSISEYRKRKQQSSGGSLTEPEPSNDTTAADKSGARDRSDSASSGTSSVSSDEEGCKMSHSLDLPGLTTLPLFTGSENEEKKGAEEGTIGWSAAPTLVERQRENLTERLKREFGLFLSDDEEERARKQGLTAEAILKARKVSPPHSSVSSTPPTYPLPQLPPQPYIPPPGSAPIHYPPFQNKPAPVLYPSFTLPQITTAQQPVYGGAVTSQATSVSNKQTQQPFLIPQTSQAPPGSNPYPPHLTVPTIKFTSPTPPPPPPPPPSTANQAYPVQSQPGQPQKSFFNHPAPRS